MIREPDENQLTLADFDWPFLEPLDEDNRWVKLAAIIPREALNEPDLKSFSNTVQGLKGSKSLSEVFGAINRFSEDIDLSVSTEFLKLPEPSNSR